MTLRDAQRGFWEWVETRKVPYAPNYIAALKQTMGQLQEHFSPDLPITDIDARQLETFVYDNGVKASTARKRQKHCKALFYWAWRRDHIPEDPSRKMDPIRSEPAEAPKIMSIDDIEFMVRKTDKYLWQLWLALGFGLRTHEVETAHISNDCVVVDGLSNKTRQRRAIPIPEYLKPIPEYSKLKWPPAKLWSTMGMAQYRGVPNVLRHTAASYWFVGLGDSKQASMLMGHTEDVFFRHYRALVADYEFARWKAIWQWRLEKAKTVTEFQL